MDTDVLLTILPYVGILLTWFFKDRLMHALNIKQKANEVGYSAISNLEQNLELFQKQIEYYEGRSNKIISDMTLRITALEDDNLKKAKSNKDLEIRIDSLEKEKNEKSMEVDKLNKKLDDITKMLKKSVKQVEFYAKHSKVELPKELQ